MPRPRTPALTVPSELTALRQWVAWKYVVRDGKPTKVPLGRHGHPVSVLDEQEWMSYSEAQGVVQKAGVGFVFSPTGPYCGVDLDACRFKDTGDFTSEALDLLEKLGSYAEVSPSGTGAKVILKARMAEGSRHKVPAPWKATTEDKHAHIECYDKGRFFTITGSVLPGYGEVTSVGASVVNEIMRDAKAESKAGEGTTKSESYISDADLVDVARLFPSTAGPMANLFVEAKRDVYGGDESKCDFVLCCALARHTDRADQIERVFRTSALFTSKPDASKWERADYVHRTISGAIKEKAEERAKDLGMNYRVTRKVKVGDLEEHASPLTVLETTNQLQRHAKGAFFLVGEAAYMAGLNKGDEPVAVASHADLTAVIGTREDMCIRWKTGVGFTTRDEAFAAMRYVAPHYHSIETVPTWPQWPEVYYNCKDLPPADAGLWERWLDFFIWETPEDRLLGSAFFATPFWGGPGGQRPLFAVTTKEGQGAGKTTLVGKVAELLGQVPIAVPSKDGVDAVDIGKRMLSPLGRKSRVLLLDNVTGKMDNPDVAALITAPVLSGRELNVGEGVRPNTFTYALTLNAPSLDADFAPRTVVLRIGRPRAYSNWETEIRRFLETHRWELIAHVIGRLKAGGGAGEGTGDFRFPLWANQVLGAMAGDEEAKARVLAMIRDRRDEHNSDQDDAEVFMFEVHKLASRLLQSVDKRATLEHKSVWIYGKVLTKIFREALNRKNLSHNYSMRLVEQMAEKGDFKGWNIRLGERYEAHGKRMTGAVFGLGPVAVGISDEAAIGCG